MSRSVRGSSAQEDGLMCGSKGGKTFTYSQNKCVYVWMDVTNIPITNSALLHNTLPISPSVVIMFCLIGENGLFSMNTKLHSLSHTSTQNSMKMSTEELLYYCFFNSTGLFLISDLNSLSVCSFF